MDDIRFLVSVSDPSDGVLLAVLARAWTGVKAHAEIITFKLFGRWIGQRKHTGSLTSIPKPTPELVLGSVVVVVIPCQDQDVLSLKLGENSHSPLDLRFGDGLFVEQVAGHHNKVGFPLVCGGDQSLQRGKTLLQQSIPNKVRVLGERDSDVVVGGVENAEAHEKGNGVGVSLFKNLIEIG
jgi:hypothetical protein